MTMGKEGNNNVMGTEEVYQEFGLLCGPWVLREQFESWAGAMM